MSRERKLLARVGLISAQYRWHRPEDQRLHKLYQTLNEYLEENPQEALTSRPFIRLTDKEIQELLGPFAGEPISGYTRKLFNKIQDKLEEKNR